MAKNNQNPPIIPAYNSTMRKIKKENRKRDARYSMDRATKIRIKALLGASLAFGSIASFIGSVFPSQSEATVTPKKEKSYSIGLPNDGATITVDGQDFTIDRNSFVIVAEDETIAYDESSNLLKGDVNAEDIKEVLEITEDEMSNYIIYQVIAESGVNVRATGSIEDDNIISTVKYQDYVLGYRPETTTSGDEWISILSTDGESIFEGYIREDLLQEITIIQNEYDLSQEELDNLMVVDTSSGPLNLRTSPDESDKRNIMTQIQNGSTVNIIGDTIISGDREWCQIEYKTKDGYRFQGWVAAEYLTPYMTQNTEPSQSTEPTEIIQETQSTEPTEVIEETQSTVPTEIIEETQVNASGNVTGIDISAIETDELRELLQSGIPENVYSSTFSDNIDTTQVAGDINFVYIKLGASPYGNTNFKPIDYNNYIEQVKVCEELGVPYGFYYYSTSITVEEAKIELEHIKQKIEELRETLGIEHNKLEIVVDIELKDASDRQYRGNIEEQTKAKATLINGIQEQGLSENVLIYGPIRVMRPDLDRIIDLSYLHSLLSNPDDVALWMCSPTYTAGKISSDMEAAISYAEEQGFSTVAHQVVLDTNVIGDIDINNMDLAHFQKLLNPEYSLDKYSNEIDNYADER